MISGKYNDIARRRYVKSLLQELMSAEEAFLYQSKAAYDDRFPFKPSFLLQERR